MIYHQLFSHGRDLREWNTGGENVDGRKYVEKIGTMSYCQSPEGLMCGDRGVGDGDGGGVTAG